MAGSDGSTRRVRDALGGEASDPRFRGGRKPFGLIGHQDIGFMWSDKTHVSLRQDLSNNARARFLERFAGARPCASSAPRRSTRHQHHQRGPRRGWLIVRLAEPTPLVRQR